MKIQALDSVQVHTFTTRARNQWYPIVFLLTGSSDPSPSPPPASKKVINSMVKKKAPEERECPPWAVSHSRVKAGLILRGHGRRQACVGRRGGGEGGSEIPSDAPAGSPPRGRALSFAPGPLLGARRPEVRDPSFAPVWEGETKGGPGPPSPAAPTLVKEADGSGGGGHSRKGRGKFKNI